MPEDLYMKALHDPGLCSRTPPPPRFPCVSLPRQLDSPLVIPPPWKNPVDTHTLLGSSGQGQLVLYASYVGTGRLLDE